MKNHIHISRGDRAFYLIVALIALLAFLCTLYPLVYLASSSISDPSAVATGRVKLWPVGFSLKGYSAVFSDGSIITSYGNSLFYAVVGTILEVSLLLPTAFALSRKEMAGYRMLNMFFVFTMWFGGGMIPTFLTVRDLGLLNTRLAILLPPLVSAFHLMICRTFFHNTIPNELYESASLDGCGYWRFLFRIVLPLSKAIVSVMVLYSFVGFWNTYFNALIYLRSRELMPLQIILKEILVQFDTAANEMMMDLDTNMMDYGLNEVLKYALIIVACLPLWIAYPFVQKYFVSGVMIGSVKG